MVRPNRNDPLGVRIPAAPAFRSWSGRVSLYKRLATIFRDSGSCLNLVVGLRLARRPALANEGL
jgi:hypothetical protein